MRREWRPGDLALVTFLRKPGGGKFGKAGEWLEPGTFLSIATPAHPGESGVVWLSSGGGRASSGRRDVVGAALPVVALDPTSPSDVLRACDALGSVDVLISTSQMRRALAWMVDLQPPQGLGAVVEDAQGHLWVRNHRGSWQCGAASTAWNNLDVVRVLSEGVQS